MSHKCSVTRRDGKYHLECEECGLITAQPANRGGLIARGLRHESSNGSAGGTKGTQVIIKAAQIKRFEIKYGANGKGELEEPADPEVAVPALVLEGAPIAFKYKEGGFQWSMHNDVCMDCKGPLKSAEGGFCTTSFPVRAVCRGCKEKILIGKA